MRSRMVGFVGVAAGFVIGYLAIGAVGVAAAQLQRFTVGDPIECAFNQPAPSLEDLATLRVGMTIDTGSEQVLTPACAGGGSPFQCAFTLPAQPVGQHRMTYRVGHFEADDSISWNEAPISHDFVVDPAKKGAPANPIGSILRKIGAAIVAGVKAIGTFFGAIF